MFLEQELHSISDVLEEPGEDGVAHPRAVVDTVNGCEVFVAVAELLVEPAVDSTDGDTCAERQHVPPFSCGHAIFSNPKGTECGGCTTAVVHPSNRFSLNPKNGELAEEQHEEHNVHNSEGTCCKGNGACAFLEGGSFEGGNHEVANWAVLAQEDAS